MNNFAAFISCEDAAKFAKEHGDKRPLAKITAEFQERAANTSTCCNCDEDVWRYAGNGMCFSCTTGEADASEDYELEPLGAVLEKIKRAEFFFEATSPEKVACPICQRKVAKSGLKAHHNAKHANTSPKGNA